jgi:xylulokinase
MDTSTTKNDMLRATLEGVAFCILDNIMLIRQLGGEINEIVITGGVAKSPLWLQIIADVTGCPISLPEETEGAPFGNAIVAGVGVGLFESFEQAIERVVKIRRNAFLPDAGNHSLYSELYQVYKGLYASLSGAFSQMEDIRKKYHL